MFANDCNSQFVTKRILWGEEYGSFDALRLHRMSSFFVVRWGNWVFYPSVTAVAVTAPLSRGAKGAEGIGGGSKPRPTARTQCDCGRRGDYHVAHCAPVLPRIIDGADVETACTVTPHPTSLTLGHLPPGEGFGCGGNTRREQAPVLRQNRWYSAWFFFIQKGCRGQKASGSR